VHFKGVQKRNILQSLCDGSSIHALLTSPQVMLMLPYCCSGGGVFSKSIRHRSALAFQMVHRSCLKLTSIRGQVLCSRFLLKALFPC
jgi:hypothetical protein